MTEIDQRALRNAFGAFMTGVTVVTTRDADGTPRGFTANSFASVSLDPPLLSACLATSSRSIETFRSAAGFAVTVLAEDQEGVAKTFAAPVENRFGAVDWAPGPYGGPILAGGAAWFDCSMHAVVEAGDHVILLGRVEAFADTGANGLGYARGGFVRQTLAAEAVAAAGAPSVYVSAVAHRGGAVLLTGPEDGLAIPIAPLSGPHGATSALAGLIRGHGLDASAGFLYAVYEDHRGQHIVYRCEAGPGAPMGGAFHPLDSLDLGRIADISERKMLERFRAESRIGDFGIYSDGPETGAIQRLASNL